MPWWSSCTLDALTSAIEKFNVSGGDPHVTTFLVCLILSTLCFIISTITGNASQVDKIWSITPFLYTWMVLFANPSDPRLIMMTVVSTIWGIRLTWNFNRRGGYTWPPWGGEEDYRWPALRKGIVPGFTALDKPIPWMLFNLTFISFYQNILLWLTATPALIAWSVTKSSECCAESSDGTCTAGSVPLNTLDYIAAFLFLMFVVIESIADNQQFAFQTEKYRRKGANVELTGEFKDGFKQSGLYAIVRKPNYAAEQSIWVCYYLFGVAATGSPFNWSIIGFILLISLFQGSGWMTEYITIEKYPKYEQVYMKKVGRYLPFWSLYFKLFGKEVKGEGMRESLVK